MYAIITTGGKQYRVTKGQSFTCEKLEVDPGQLVDFNEVLMIADGKDIKIGDPFISGSKVKAEVLEHGRRKKIEILKFRRRKHHMKHQGHRQYYTKVKIVEIEQ